jgi:hypothetical protein
MERRFFIDKKSQATKAMTGRLESPLRRWGNRFESFCNTMRYVTTVTIRIVPYFILNPYNPASHHGGDSKAFGNEDSENRTL